MCIRDRNKAASVQPDAQDGLIFSTNENVINEVLKGGATPESLKAALGYSAVAPANADTSVQVKINTTDGPRIIFAQAVDSTNQEALAAAQKAAERQKARLPEQYQGNSTVEVVTLADAQSDRRTGQTAAYEETGEGGVALPLDPLVQTINDLSKERDAILDQVRVDNAETYDIIKRTENRIKELVADKVQILNQIRAERDIAQPIGIEGVDPEIREFLDNILRNNVAAGIRNEVDLYNKLFTGGLRRATQQDALQVTHPEAVDQIQTINNDIESLENSITGLENTLSSEIRNSLDVSYKHLTLPTKA
mgnify:CR=1 FL=1